MDGDLHDVSPSPGSMCWKRLNSHSASCRFSPEFAVRETAEPRILAGDRSRARADSSHELQPFRDGPSSSPELAAWASECPRKRCAFFVATSERCHLPTFKWLSVRTVLNQGRYMTVSGEGRAERTLSASEPCPRSSASSAEHKAFGEPRGALVSRLHVLRRYRRRHRC